MYWEGHSLTCVVITASFVQHVMFIVRSLKTTVTVSYKVIDVLWLIVCSKRSHQLQSTQAKIHQVHVWEEPVEQWWVWEIQMKSTVTFHYFVNKSIIYIHYEQNLFNLTWKQKVCILCLCVYKMWCNLAKWVIVRRIVTNLQFAAQIYTRDSRTCAILIPAWGWIWGSLGVSHNQNNRSLSGTYANCMDPICACRQTRAKCCTEWGKTSWTHLFSVYFCVCGQQNPKRPPNWAPWLTTPLHWVVWEVWDLWCISVVCWQHR